MTDSQTWRVTTQCDPHRDAAFRYAYVLHTGGQPWVSGYLFASADDARLAGRQDAESLAWLMGEGIADTDPPEAGNEDPADDDHWLAVQIGEQFADAAAEYGKEVA